MGVRTNGPTDRHPDPDPEEVEEMGREGPGRLAEADPRQAGRKYGRLRPAGRPAGLPPSFPPGHALRWGQEEEITNERAKVPRRRTK